MFDPCTTKVLVETLCPLVIVPNDCVDGFVSVATNGFTTEFNLIGVDAMDRQKNRDHFYLQ